MMRLIVILLSPVLYPLTHRRDGHSWRDYWRFLNGE